MRIRVYETSDRFKDYPSMKIACDVIGKKEFKQLVKDGKAKRLYEKGYWNNFDETFLKYVGTKHKDVGYCLIE